MSDLISRSELIDYFYYGIDDKPIIDGISDRKIIDIIKNQPTAYDVDKVVEELEELRRIDICKNIKCSERSYPDCSECSQNLIIDRAIEIVKAGVRK